ncbi:hypothetical protein P0D88_16845 [Paraburkholderia sp. RL18-103-BIB-C]|uniref:hypothetical protein n=1 Tax=Paraburkholderia sp. RL18-103-BIB-C TaxID=3031637 RepID=UPI0038BB8D87
MDAQFFDVFSTKQLFERACIGDAPAQDPTEPDWVSMLEEIEEIDPWLTVTIWAEVDYAVTLFRSAASIFIELDNENGESELDRLERYLSNHLFTLSEIYDDDIYLEPVALLIEKMLAHTDQMFHPAMLLITYAFWCIDKAVSGLLERDISQSTFGMAVSGAALMEAFRTQLETPAGIAVMNTIVQTQRARERHARDPKQTAKKDIKNRWIEWQTDRTLYKGKAGFARQMLKEHSVLDSQKVIEDWCRTWEQQKNEQIYQSSAD